MEKIKVFVDGNVGTTGMQIEERLEKRKDIALLKIPESERKNPEAIKKFMSEADITFLCLPDEAAREAVALSEGTNTRIIDASTAHRTLPEWAYGFPELEPEFKERIKTANKVAVPGCHASGFISLVRPLVKAGIIANDAELSATSLTGYSGGGKKHIEKYEGEQRDKALLKAPMPYALSLKHKHLPEMKAICGLLKTPLFMPVVGDYYKGMLVTVPIFGSMETAEKIVKTYEDCYNGSRFVKVMGLNRDLSESGGFLNPEAVNGTNCLEISVFSNNGTILLAAVLDNLGKGSGGAAVQCMNLMLGIDEGESL